LETNYDSDAFFDGTQLVTTLVVACAETGLLLGCVAGTAMILCTFLTNATSSERSIPF